MNHRWLLIAFKYFPLHFAGKNTEARVVGSSQTEMLESGFLDLDQVLFL